MEVAQSPGKETGRAKSQDRELTHQFPEVWAEDTAPPPEAWKTVLTGNRTQTRNNDVSAHLGPTRLC